VTPRRQKGEGGITHRADGRWQGYVWVLDAATGKKRKSPYIYAATEDELEVKLAVERVRPPVLTVAGALEFVRRETGATTVVLGFGSEAVPVAKVVAMATPPTSFERE